MRGRAAFVDSALMDAYRPNVNGTLLPTVIDQMLVDNREFSSKLTPPIHWTVTSPLIMACHIVYGRPYCNDAKEGVGGITPPKLNRGG